MKQLLHFLFFVLLIASYSHSNAQTILDITPEDAIEEIIGEGIEFSNVEFYGTENQIGYLVGGGGPFFPMNEGLIASSGCAVQLLNDTECDVAGLGLADFPDLLDVANSVPPLIDLPFMISDINDLCFIEFDFIPTYNTISLDYCFASNEWPTWINSSFNDVFAFFLSGPGIEGPYESPEDFDGAVNMAYIPDTEPPLPVTVSSVNTGNPMGIDCVNCDYFIENGPDPDYTYSVQGVTTVFNIEYDVIPNETYHIKLAIADGSDGALNAYMCMVGNSFFSFTSVGVDEKENELRVYPNPSNGQFKIDINGDFDVEILTLDGRIAYHTKGMDEGLIDVSDLPKGNYVLKVMNMSQVYTEQILIE